MARRNLLATVQRVLKGMGLMPQRIEGSTALGFMAPGENAVYQGAATIVANRLVVFYSTLSIPVPPARLGQIAAWMIRINDDVIIGNFELDFNDGSLRFKTSMDTAAVPTEALEEVLVGLWGANVASMDMRLRDVMAIMFGGEGDDEEIINALGALVGGAERDDGLGEVFSEVEEDLFDEIWELVVEAYGEEVAGDLQGALGELASTFTGRLEMAGDPEVEVRCRLGTEGADAVLTLAADGTEPVNFRFNPEHGRRTAQQDEHGIVLYHSTTPAKARAILERGFRNEVHEVAGDHERTLEGYPQGAAETRKTRRVPLTAEPLPLDDRGVGTSVLRLVWEGDASVLRTYEYAQTAYVDSDAVMERPAIRRFYVPVALLNRAVADGIVKIGEAVS